MQDFLINLLNSADSPIDAAVLILKNGGLIPLFPILVWMSWKGWIQWIQNVYDSQKKYVLLAVDVPKANEQSMKAIEQIIVQMHGVYVDFKKNEKYWDGKWQDMTSLEIVSIDGYIQYFIRCDWYNVGTIKSAIFAQYPDAEIVEVEDYVNNVPREYPNATHEMWATDMVLRSAEAFPIKTYDLLEHPLTGLFVDPMAALLEAMSRLLPGEQVWVQIIVYPTNNEWTKASGKVVDKMIGKKVHVKKNVADRVGDVVLGSLNVVNDAVFGTTEVAPKKEEKNAGNFLNMTTGEKWVVEMVENKTNHTSFKAKVRLLYIAKKELWHRYRVPSSIVGAIKQFDSGINGFKNGRQTTTSRPVAFKKIRQNWRKTKIARAYRLRSDSGQGMFVLSPRELATMFHFPQINVKAPLVSKAVSKKAEPPVQLPFESTPFAAFRREGAKIVVENTAPYLKKPESTTTSPGKKSATPPFLEPAAEPDPIATQATEDNAELPVTPPPIPRRMKIPSLPSDLTPEEQEARSYPLHSMPGLPPGVRPVAQPYTPPPGTQQPYRPIIPQPQRSQPHTPAPPQEPPQSSQNGSVHPPSNLPFG